MGHPSEMYRDLETAGSSDAALKEGNRRSAEAGCPKPNRCGNAPYGTGWQCDEFPFKSTDRSRVMQKGVPPINRCVPERQNRCKLHHNLTRLECTLVLTLFTIVQGNVLK
jgi:hypothetical protein